MIAPFGKCDFTVFFDIYVIFGFVKTALEVQFGSVGVFRKTLDAKFQNVARIIMIDVGQDFAVTPDAFDKISGNG